RRVVHGDQPDVAALLAAADRLQPEEIWVRRHQLAQELADLVMVVVAVPRDLHRARELLLRRRGRRERRGERRGGCRSQGPVATGRTKREGSETDVARPHSTPEARDHGLDSWAEGSVISMVRSVPPGGRTTRV